MQHAFAVVFALWVAFTTVFMSSFALRVIDSLVMSLLYIDHSDLSFRNNHCIA